MSYQPGNEQSEQYIIGALLRDGSAYDVISDGLKASDFHSSQMGAAYKAITTLVDNGESIDPFLIADLVDPSNAGVIASRLGEIFVNTPSAANILTHARKVADKSKLREMIDAHEKSLQLLKSEDGSINEKLHHSIANINAIDPDDNDKSMHSESMHDIALNWLNKYEEKIADPEGARGLTLGIDGLDEIIGERGIQPGDVVVVAARPKMFKTATMTKISNHIGLTLNKPLQTFSMEMKNNLMFERHLTQESGVTNDNFYKPMGDHNFAKVNQAMSSLIPSQMYIDDRSNLTLAQVRREVRLRVKELGGYGKLGGIMLDYFTLMDLGADDKNPAFGYSKLSKGIVSLAKEVGCPIFLLAQLNRDCEKRPDKRPMPFDLGDTGQLERDASLIIMLYNDVIYNDDSPMAGILELIIRVNRNGNTGTAYQTTTGGRLGDISPSEIGHKIADAEYKEKQNKSNGGWGK